MADLPAHLTDADDNLVARAKSSALGLLLEYASAVCCLTPIKADYGGVQSNELFRLAGPQDRNVVYKWRCDCVQGLDCE